MTMIVDSFAWKSTGLDLAPFCHTYCRIRSLMFVAWVCLPIGIPGLAFRLIDYLPDLFID